jgi:hypothetical protein
MRQGAGGSWAGTTFTGPGPATGGTQFDPTYDPYSVYAARKAAAQSGGGGGGGSGGNVGYNAQGQITFGPLNPDTMQRAPAGMIWVSRGGGGGTDGTSSPQWYLEADPYYSAGGGTGGAGGGGGGSTTSLPGWGIQPAVPWLTTSYLQSYGGRPAPYANIHEQIGAAMQGHPAALPPYQWAIPEEMFAAQPGATGMPPGGWTQMLGYTPGVPSNYGFIGGRPSPYGPAAGPVGINPTIG